MSDPTRTDPCIWCGSASNDCGDPRCCDECDHPYPTIREALAALHDDIAALSTTPAPLDAGKVAAAMNDAQIDPGELRLGHDLLPVAERIAREYTKP